MISVALCTYNGEKYLSQQLDSILSQTMPVDELVIVDDCSQDSTCNIVHEYLTRYPDIIKLYRNSFNLGSSKNFEKALKECQGDYIFFSDQDDVWREDKVEVTVSYLKKTNMLGVFSNGKLIDGNNNQMDGQTLFSILNLLPFIKSGFMDKCPFELLCLKRNFVTGAALTITKTAKEMVLPFRVSDYIIHDMWIALRLSESHKLGCIDDCLISYRIHQNQQVGLDFDKSKVDPLFDCFLNIGNCRELLPMRRYSSVPVFYCGLNKIERKMISRTYRQLYFNNMSNGICSKIKDVFLFVVSEAYYFIRTVIGYK